MVADPKSIVCDVLIRNGVVLTLDHGRRIFDRGAVAIRGNAIVWVGCDRDVDDHYRAARVIDAGGGIVHPGFIDAHNHIVHSTCRGIFGEGIDPEPDIPFATWKADVTSDDEFAATQAAALEMLRNGFTMYVEPGTAFDCDAVAAATEGVGIRALLAGCYLWDQIETMRFLGRLDSEVLYRRAPPSLKRCLAGLGSQLHRNRNPDALVRGYVAVYGLGTASDELLRAARAASDEAGVAFHQHEGYTPEATAGDEARIGGSRISRLARVGALGPRSTLVHMYVLRDRDIAEIRDNGASVIWCPAAYLQLGINAGAPIRTPELVRQGVTVAIGTDGGLNCVIGDGGIAGYLVAGNVGMPLSPGQILEMQTIKAAQVAGVADLVGSLEAGKRADVVVRGADLPECMPAVNPVHQLALTMRAGTVDIVLVNGREIVRGGRCVTVNDQQVFAKAQQSVRERMGRLGLKPRRYWAN
jgi:5-methylthioadenosine/S-adenosylhomocysteine deaminase